MRRSAPRPLGEALRKLAADGAPQTLLARVQAAWPGSSGAYADHTEPVSERGGRVSVACSSAAIAQHLTMTEPDVRGLLNDALGGSGEGPVTGLRFSYGPSAERPSGRRL